MELQFHEPMVRWRSKQAVEVAPTIVPESIVTVAFPMREGGYNKIRSTKPTPLPCLFTLSFEDEQEMLDHGVEFKLVSDGQPVATHTVTLRECIPMLEDSSIEWVSRVTQAKQETEAHVVIPITTNRRPREAIANVLAYRNQALSIAQKLALHKNAVAIGLLPPIIGCFLGVLLTSPLWVPFVLFIGILGFPIWIVLGVAASLVIAISAVSSVITVKTIQSKRVKSSIRELAQSPSGQYVLFANSGNKNMPSPTEFKERLIIYVNEDPSRKLLASLLIDFIGNASFALPGIGELADVLWAPASASFVSAMYSESSPSAKYFAFMEEFLPFTDFIPTATLAWLKENLNKDDFRKYLSKLGEIKKKAKE